jgi:hypothetical protein
MSHYGQVSLEMEDLDGILSALLWLERFSKNFQLMFIQEELI